MRALANIVSYVFHPMFLPAFTFLLIFQLETFIKYSVIEFKQWFVVLWVFINTGIIPLLFTLFLRRKKLITDLHLRNRKERLLPFLFTFLFFVTNYVLMLDILLPSILYSIMLGGSVAVGMALIFTLVDKISIHMIGMGALFASVFCVVQAHGNTSMGILMILLLFSGVVGTARLVMREHRLSQVLMGWMVGFFAVYLPVSWQLG